MSEEPTVDELLADVRECVPLFPALDARCKSGDLPEDWTIAYDMYASVKSDEKDKCIADLQDENATMRVLLMDLFDWKGNPTDGTWHELVARGSRFKVDTQESSSDGC